MVENCSLVVHRATVEFPTRHQVWFPRELRMGVRELPTSSQGPWRVFKCLACNNSVSNTSVYNRSLGNLKVSHLDRRLTMTSRRALTLIKKATMSCDWTKRPGRQVYETEWTRTDPWEVIKSLGEVVWRIKHCEDDRSQNRGKLFSAFRRNLSIQQVSWIKAWLAIRRNFLRPNADLHEMVACSTYGVIKLRWYFSKYGRRSLNCGS